MSEFKINKIDNVVDPQQVNGSTPVEQAPQEKEVFSPQKKEETDKFSVSKNKANPVVEEAVKPTAAAKLDELDAEKDKAEQKTADKKEALRKEIDDLIQNDKTISNEIKNEYAELAEQQRVENQEYAEKKQKLEAAKRDIEIAQAEIERRKAERENLKDDARKAEIDGEIESLSADIVADSKTASTLSDELDALKKSMSSTDKKMTKLYKKLEKTNAETARKIRDKEQELKKADSDLDSELDEISKRKDAAEKEYLSELLQAGIDKANYENIAGGYKSGGPVSANAAGALARATGEIGVRERTGHNDGAEINKYRNGVANGAAWCASFVSWCYKGNDVFGYSPSVTGIMQAAQKKGLYAAKGSYAPKAGDVMIQKSNGASHTGIVESVDPDGTIHTIEGNASNSVRRVTYRPGSKGYNQISGWVKMS